MVALVQHTFRIEKFIFKGKTEYAADIYNGMEKMTTLYEPTYKQARLAAIQFLYLEKHL